MKDKFIFLGMIAGAWLLSWVPIIHWPFSWMETFFHEISHGLAALATGGRILKIELHWVGSGLCWTQGGWSWLVTWSGYVGAVVWGGVIYWGATTASHRVTPWLMGSLLALLATSLILWARDLVTILILFIMMAVILLPLRLKNAPAMNWFLRFSGIYVVMNAVRSPLALLDGRHVGDGATLSDKAFLPEIFWVAQWEIIALAVLWLLWKMMPPQQNA